MRTKGIPHAPSALVGLSYSGHRQPASNIERITEYFSESTPVKPIMAAEIAGQFDDPSVLIPIVI